MDINKDFSLLISEGVHDKGIFKAVFLNGGPGSGKDYVLKNVLHPHGMVEINADKAHEFLSDKDHNFSKTSPDENHVQKKIKNIPELRQLLALHGRNGVVINGSGDDHKKTKEIKKGLEKLGYDTAMVHVHADDEVSKKRNIERSQRGGRSIPEPQRKQKWDAAQEARRHHAQMFGDNYIEYDNSADLREAEPELVKQKHEELGAIHDHVHNFVNTPAASEKSQKWVEKQLKVTETTPTPRKGTDKLPHPDSMALQQAKENGLTYYGNGKYGKNGKVTHYSVHDQLSEIPEEKPTPKVKPKKNIKEMFTESVSITITGDNVEEVTELIGKFKGEEKEQEQTSSSNEALTLGKHVDPVGASNEGITLSNADIDRILREEEETLLDEFGNPKIYLLKSMAQREAVVNEGTVCINPGGRGYIVRVKKGKRNDTTMVKETFSEERREEGRTGLITEAKEESCVCQEKQDRKPITFDSLKKKIKESIDKGIEPGLSMTTGGEAPLRSVDKKKSKDKLEELTGDETTASIGDQKEDELKKKGLESFRTRPKRVI